MPPKIVKGDRRKIPSWRPPAPLPTSTPRLAHTLQKELAETPRANRNHPKASFMGIPVELRLMILEDILVTKEVITHTKASTAAIHPAILKTCADLYLEGVHVLYSKNTFGITICKAGSLFWGSGEPTVYASKALIDPGTEMPTPLLAMDMRNFVLNIDIMESPKYRCYSWSNPIRKTAEALEKADINSLKFNFEFISTVRDSGMKQLKGPVPSMWCLNMVMRNLLKIRPIRVISITGFGPEGPELTGITKLLKQPKLVFLRQRKKKSKEAREVDVDAEKRQELQQEQEQESQVARHSKRGIQEVDIDAEEEDEQEGQLERLAKRVRGDL